MEDFFSPDSATKKEAFFEEFPFLSHYTSPKRVDYVKVRRIDEDLLRTPKLWGRMYLLNKDGEEIAKVRLASTWSLLGKRESVFDTIKRIRGRISEIYFILSIYSWSIDPEVSGRVSLKLYKVPKHETVQSVVERLKQEYRKDLIV